MAMNDALTVLLNQQDPNTNQRASGVTIAKLPGRSNKSASS